MATGLTPVAAQWKNQSIAIRPALRDSEDEPEEKGGKLYDDADGMSDMAFPLRTGNILSVVSAES